MGQPDDRVTHVCPAPECTLHVAPEHLACSRHWYSIPRETRNELWREYRHRFGRSTYWAARARCLQALGVPVDQVADMNAGVTVAQRVD